MYIMVPKQMESATKFGINRIMNTKINKDAKEFVTFHQYQNMGPKKSRRFRSAFTTEQVNYLEMEFKKCPYIGSANRKEIADVLNISEKAVKIWFQNRRMREKKENGTIYLTDNQTKNNDRPGKEQNNNHKLPKMCESSHSNQLNNDKSKIETSNVAMFLSSQNEPNQFECAKVSQSNNNCDTSPTVQNNAAIPTTNHQSTLSKTQGNICAFYDNPIITSKYFECKKGIHLGSPSIKDLPQDLSSKKRLTQKPMSLNQQFVPVNINSDQNYVPMYNFCNTSLPIGAEVTTSIPVPTRSTVAQGNIIWKPVNMLPGSGLTSVGMARSNEISSINQNTRRSCSCNCHEHSQSHSPITAFNQDTRTQLQYLLAIPLNSACNQL